MPLTGNNTACGPNTRPCPLAGDKATLGPHWPLESTLCRSLAGSDESLYPGDPLEQQPICGSGARGILSI